MSWNLIKNKKELGFYSKSFNDKYIFFSRYLLNEPVFINNQNYLTNLVKNLKGVSLIFNFLFKLDLL